jgi:hypothetical protein
MKPVEKIMRLLILVLFAATSVVAQERQSAPPPKSDPADRATQTTPDKNADVVVFSGVATTARVADPNERVVFNGRVMRMADFVAAVSSSSGAVQHLRTPEKHNRETERPTPPSKPSN